MKFFFEAGFFVVVIGNPKGKLKEKEEEQKRKAFTVN